jgi:hypothetical protein
MGGSLTLAAPALALAMELERLWRRLQPLATPKMPFDRKRSVSGVIRPNFDHFLS